MRPDEASPANEAVAGMNFILAAGGTGGHMIPAHALAAELKSRGHGVMLITDERGARYPGLFDTIPVYILPAGRLGGGPIGWVKAIAAVIAGRSDAGGGGGGHPPRGRATGRGAPRTPRAPRPAPHPPAKHGLRLRRLSGLSIAARGIGDGHPKR